jgi:hypothetical protein
LEESLAGNIEFYFTIPDILAVKGHVNAKGLKNFL